MKYLLPMIFFLSACSMEQKHSGTVNFSITVDQIVLTKYFKAKCEYDLPGAPDEVIDACVTLSIGQFLDAVSEIAGTPSQTP